MAGSVNKVIIIGNVGADPDIRRLSSGDAVANLRIATSESWRDRNTGERRERAEWHSVVIFNENLVKVVEQYVKKGAKLYIEGQLQTRKWQDQQNNDRYTTEIVLQKFRGELQMLDSRADSLARNQAGGGFQDNQLDQSHNNANFNNDRFNQSGDTISDFSRELDDEVPF